MREILINPVLYAAGGAVGALARWFFATSFRGPLGTFSVNVIGCFLMGLALVYFVELGDKPLGKWQVFVMSGVLGGFTTYSAFALDTLRLYEADNLTTAILYVFGTLVLCLIAVLVGAIMGRAWL